MATPYRNAVLATSGLVSLWPFDETEGTTATDVQGALNGTYSGSMSLNQTSLLPNGEGKSSHFTGGKMEKGDVAALRLGKEAMSVECWMKADSLASTNYSLWDNTNRGYSMFLNTNVGHDWLPALGGTTKVEAAGTLVKETVYHIVLTSTGTKVVIYVNGVAVKTDEAFTAGATNSNAGVAFAGNPSAGGTVFQGYGQFFAVYNSALSAATVAAHYAAASESTSSGTSAPSITRKPPLELDVEVETADGSVFRLPSASLRAKNRPLSISFGTQRGDGFATASLTLSREIFREYPDIGLLDTWRLIGRNGEIAYEGRLHSNPRTNDPSEQISIALVGWMTYLKGRKIAPLIIDRRVDQWGEPSTQRRAEVVALSARYAGEVTTGRQDSGAAGPAVIFNFSQDFNKTYAEIAEAFFYAGGEDIGKIRYDFTGPGADASWDDIVYLSSNDLASSVDTGTDHSGTSATNQTVTASTTGRKYALIDSIYRGEFAGAVNFLRSWPWPRVIGNHGLTLREEGTQSAEGYYLSEIIEYILRTYFPKVTWAGQTNTFVVPQAAWQDAPTDGYSIIQQLNNLALFETNMWEGPTFSFEPADLTTYDWQIKTTDPGVTVLFEGDSIEEFANGVAVTFTDILTGKKTVLYPPDHEELRDDSESNPANKQGEYLWTDVEVPNACLEAEALQYGRAYLAEYLRPKRPGTYRVQGHIRDYAGHHHQVWKVRCSESLGILDHPEDAPRLITATSYDDESKTLTISTDAPGKTLEAIVARQEIARTTRGL